VPGVDALRAGSGGRSSVSGVTATVFGASGFLGRYVCQALGNAGTRLVLPHRCDELDVQHLRLMGDLGQVNLLPHFDIRDDAAVATAMARSDVVVNMVGADAETWNYSFEEVHVGIAGRLARAAAAAGVARFLHVSALGAAPDAPSARLRTKAAGEAAVRAALGERAVVLRPAPMTGTEDRLFNTYANWIKMLPFVPLAAGGAARRQPVWVRDVAAAAMAALERRDAAGRAYDLAGPEVMTVRELVAFAAATVREAPTVVPLPAAAMRAAAAVPDWLAKRSPFRGPAAFTADALAEAELDLVFPAAAAGALGFDDLGLRPHKVTEGLPIEYLRHYRSGGYDLGSTGESGSDASFAQPPTRRVGPAPTNHF
jgi:NADH dehydrogenase (ubiquinone) 1 alpha subcomplex subunit 9